VRSQLHLGQCREVVDRSAKVAEHEEFLLVPGQVADLVGRSLRQLLGGALDCVIEVTAERRVLPDQDSSCCGVALAAPR
jgi:hypothetical protein